MLYQDQFAVIGELSGPGRLCPLSFQQSLLTADLSVSFPTWKTLRTERDGKKEEKIIRHIMLIVGCKSVDAQMYTAPFRGNGR